MAQVRRNFLASLYACRVNIVRLFSVRATQLLGTLIKSSPIIIVIILALCFIMDNYIFISSHIQSSPSALYENGGTIPHGFRYIVNNRRLCEDSDNLTYLVYVFSAPSEHAQRCNIRKTWGKRLLSDGLRGRLVFMLGKPHNQSLQQEILREFNKHRDIVQQDFIDHYRNLTFKSVAALRWINTYCTNVRYVIKTDVDVIIDTYALVDYFKSNDSQVQRSFVCFIFFFSFVTRWGKNSVPYKQYPYVFYPRYCCGGAYIISNDLISDLYNATFHVRYQVNEDAYTTGFLPVAVGNFNHVFWDKIKTYPVDLSIERYDQEIPVISIPSTNAYLKVWDKILQRIQ